MQTIAKAAAALDAGGKSRALIEEALARINDKSGEGARTFLKVHAEHALAAGDFYDRLRAGGAAPSRFAGLPVSLKDRFDIAMVVLPCRQRRPSVSGRVRSSSNTFSGGIGGISA